MARRPSSAYRAYRERYTTRVLRPGADAVTCRICGEKLRFMGTHLVRRHGITAAQYRERFPNAPTVSPTTSAMYSDVLIDIAGTEAPTAVGINAERQLGVGWTPETCITALKEFSRLHRRPPTYREWRSTASGRPSTSTLLKLFGSFNAALAAADLPTMGRGTPTGRRRKRCKNGHPLTPRNRVEVSPGRCRCRKCLIEYQRAYQRERKRRERAARAAGR